MKIRIEVDSAAQKHPSGIGYYTQRLTNALAADKNIGVSAFFFNFLRRQTQPTVSSNVAKEQNVLFPLRIYAKLQSHNVAPAFDAFLKPVDLTIFPNYARWPSIRSRYTATAIHDLTYLNYPEMTEEGNLLHLQRSVKQAIKSSDFIITISESIKKELMTTFSIPDSSIVVTPIPPDEQFFIPNHNEVHKKYHIPTEKYLFFISTIEPRKNIPLLVSAFILLPKEITDSYSLVLAGGMGWKSDESRDAVKNAQAKGFHVIFTGYIDEKDKSALYQKASLFVMPSLYEGFGMPILEAAASKTPIVASDIAVFRESVGDGAAFFESNSVRSLKETIIKTLSDTDYQKKLVQTASKKLSTSSWEQNVQKIISKVEELKKEH